MVCIYCSNKTKVTNVRLQIRRKTVWRRRQCLTCHAIFTSIEGTDLSTAISVIKRAGVLEPFSADKLFLSIYKALGAQNAATVAARALADTVTAQLLRKPSTSPIPTTDIATITKQVVSRYNAPSGQRYWSFQAEKRL